MTLFIWLLKKGGKLINNDMNDVAFDYMYLL